MTERQLRRLQAQALKDRPVRFDGEDDFLVIHPFVVACAPGDKVLMQQSGQGHGYVQVRVGRQGTEPQGLHQLDIQLPQLAHPFARPVVRPVRVLIGPAAEEVICLHACASPCPTALSEGIVAGVTDKRELYATGEQGGDSEAAAPAPT
ncbi:hypothetical protein GCM10018771_05220 [Streptomyces cellulosae]|nr:hypothetical protein GCM10018771_05220 [Streptomyces cellulosae]